MVEKDFWVCWVLSQIFDEFRQVVFKGGTSLSKVHRVINRFSEDVDLSLNPELIGAEESMFDTLRTRGARERAVQDLEERCARFTREHLAPRLEARITREIGEPPSTGAWLRYELDTASHSPVLQFQYPTAPMPALEYLARSIKLELGSLTEQEPVGTHTILPWVAEDFPAAFSGWHCEVVALDLVRTFWEKATILHAEYHRPKTQPLPPRYARHYSDLVNMLRHPSGEANLADDAMARRVVNWKSRLFARSWARYDLAQRGSFRLTPSPERADDLRDDYLKMRPMFIQEPLPFEELVLELAAAERTLNS